MQMRTAVPGPDEILRVIVEEATDYAFIVLDRGGAISSWNPGAQALFGFSGEEIIGQHVSALFTIEDVRDRVPELELEKAILEGKAVDARWHVRSDGTRFFADGITRSFTDPDGRLVGFVKIARDATPLKHAEEERQRLLLRAQELGREKDDFFAAVSHELRTPLTAITGWLALLAHDTKNEQLVRDGLSSLQQATQTLSKLVDDLLDSVRSRTGKMRVVTELVDLGSVVRDAVQAFRISYGAKKIEVQEEIAKDVMVLGDATRLQQVVWNLVANAINHTPEGGTLRVSLRVESGSAILEVSDSGVGIDAEFLPYIFEPFRQKRSGNEGGLGLGLAIARSLVELHGGTIAASSDGVGHGATFTVAFPLAAA